MLSSVRRILDYQMTVAEWIGTAVLLGTPYLAIGVVYSLFDTDHLAHVDGLQKVAAVVGGVVFWPVLLLARACVP